MLKSFKLIIRLIKIAVFPHFPIDTRGGTIICEVLGHKFGYDFSPLNWSQLLYLVSFLLSLSSPLLRRGQLTATSWPSTATRAACPPAPPATPSPDPGTPEGHPHHGRTSTEPDNALSGCEVRSLKVTSERQWRWVSSLADCRHRCVGLPIRPRRGPAPRGISTWTRPRVCGRCERRRDCICCLQQFSHFSGNPGYC